MENIHGMHLNIFSRSCHMCAPYKLISPILIAASIVFLRCTRFMYAGKRCIDLHTRTASFVWEAYLSHVEPCVSRPNDVRNDPQLEHHTHSRICPTQRLPVFEIVSSDLSPPLAKLQQLHVWPTSEHFWTPCDLVSPVL